MSFASVTITLFPSLQRIALALSLGLFAQACIIEERKFDQDEADRVAAAARDADDPDDSTSSDDADASSSADAATTAAPSPECSEYCSRALENCTDELAIYASEEACLAVCALLPLSSDDSNNTVECRSEQARLARATGEPDVHCPEASPGGSRRGGGEGCGTNCESFCRLQPQICPGDDVTVPEFDECMRRCAVIPDHGAFDVDVDHDADNVQCRLVHVSSAALGPTSAIAHCWHSTIAPGPASPCQTRDTPRCEHYCDVVMEACQEDLAVYETRGQCLSACSTLDPGEGSHTTQNTVGCRLYHAYSALAAPAQHCSHASPAGDGHCGVDNCESYCTIAQGLCQDEFDEAFDSREACLQQCASLEGAEADTGYSIEQATSGGGVACRVYNAIASADDASLCAAAFGAAPCDE